MTAPYYADDAVTIYAGDCLDVLAALPPASVDAIVTDPPYGLEFMGKEWDGADGFRRSLNPADAGRDSVFGRTSRVAPEYRTDSKSSAGMAETGYTDGGKRLARPDYTGGLNPKCLACNRWQRGSNPCRCDEPEWTQERLVRLHTFQEWCEAWATECLRVLKPGGYLLAFGGSRTWHRLACAVEDAGFEIRDSIAWLYGSGFPKSLDVSKAIDKAAGAEREVIGQRSTAAGIGGRNMMSSEHQAREGYRPNGFREVSREVDVTAPATDAARAWQGWGTALKPAFEPIVVGRKPLAGTVAANVQAHGTGALNIDACRVGTDTITAHGGGRNEAGGRTYGMGSGIPAIEAGSNPHVGRWPANVVLDGSQADVLDQQTGVLTSGVLAAHHARAPKESGILGAYGSAEGERGYGDTGGASRFFPTFRYEAKAGSAERPRGDDGTAHPTVKPLDLMRWLVRLVTPPGGLVLDPFLGSGTTAEACVLEHFRCIGIERDPAYLPLAVARLSKPLNIGFDFGAVS